MISSILNIQRLTYQYQQKYNITTSICAIPAIEQVVPIANSYTRENSTSLSKHMAYLSYRKAR